MTSPQEKRPLSDRLEQLGEAIVAAKRRARECEIAKPKVSGEIAQMTDQILEAHADNEEQHASKASAARAKLEGRTLRDAEERWEGAKRAVSKAEAEGDCSPRRASTG